MKMDFDAYLGSSSGESGNESGPSVEGGGLVSGPNDGPTGKGGKVASGPSGEGGEGTTQAQKLAKYRSLLTEEEGGEEGGRKEEQGEMEITWEPGLSEGVEKMVSRRRRKGGEEGGGATTWETYLLERRKRLKEKRKQKLAEVG